MYTTPQARAQHNTLDKREQAQPSSVYVLSCIENKNTPGIVQFCGARRTSQVIHNPSRACFGVILSALLQLLL